MRALGQLIAATAVLLFAPSLATVATAAEITKVRIAQQGTISYLPLIVMGDRKFLERRAAEYGLAGVTVEWKQLSGGNSQNDALFSGSIEFASGGIPPFLKLWSKVKRTQNSVVGVTGVAANPIILTTRNPGFRTLKDIGPKDRIAVSAVKVSTQAVLLQMEAARLFGYDKYEYFDRYTIALPLAESHQIMMSGASSQLTSDFYGGPGKLQQLATPGIHKVTDSEEILGGPGSAVIIYTTERIYRENPRLVKALLAAQRDAVEFIAANPALAAEIFRKTTRSKLPTDLLVKSIGDARKTFAPAPRAFMKFANFMNRIGQLPDPPKSWKDMFIKEVHQLNGD